ncbi:hypothetical protein V1523DRAFT_429435 [Lipomyces doorenjongii]
MKKSKCDGSQPCFLCHQAGTLCVYRCQERQQQVSRVRHITEAADTLNALVDWVKGILTVGNRQTPIRHFTSTKSLLEWSSIKALFQHALDPAFAQESEIASARMQSIFCPARMETEQIETARELYFKNCHPFHPFVSRSRKPIPWLPDKHSFATADVTLQTQQMLIATIGASTTSPVKGLYHFALSNIGYIIASSSIESVEVFLLLALVYSKECRTIPAWRYITMASSALCVHVESIIRGTLWRTHLGERVCRLSWVTLILEGRILAEFNFPATALSQYEDILPLPFSTQVDEGENLGEEYHYYFLTHISIRRLLNRTQSSIYADEGRFNQVRLELELLSQLQELELYFPSKLSGSLLAHAQMLLVAAKYVICRPSVYRIMHFPESILPDDTTRCVMCFKAICESPVASRDDLDYDILPLPFLMVQATFGKIMVLLAANNMPHMRQYLPTNWLLGLKRMRNLIVHFTATSSTVRKDLEIIDEACMKAM